MAKENNWAFTKFARESWKYTKGYSRLYYLTGLLPAWYRFNRLQKADSKVATKSTSA